MAVLEQVYDFDEKAYLHRLSGIESIPRDLFLEWWYAHPTGFLCTLEGGRPIAVVGLFPVTEDWSNRFLTHQTSECELRAATIRLGAVEGRETPGTHWYLSGLSSISRGRSTSISLPRLLGFSLLRWLNLSQDLIGAKDITIAAEASTPIGEKLLRQYFGFCSEGQTQGTARHRRFWKRTGTQQIIKLLGDDPLFKRCADLQEELTRYPTVFASCDESKRSLTGSREHVCVPR